MATLLSLPLELRLQIFSHVLHINKAVVSAEETTVRPEKQFIKKLFGDPDGRLIVNAQRPTLLFHNIDPLVYRRSATLTWPRWRSIYSIRCDRFRARTLVTTYQCMNITVFGGSLDLLMVNNQLHTEAARLLYGSFTFDFDTHIEAIIPFLSDLSPFSRSCINSIAFIKRALAYEKDYDQCEWSNAMQYLSNPRHGICLQRLYIGVVAGRPGDDGWENVERYTADDFETLSNADNMTWLRSLLQVPVARDIEITPLSEHCPPATNSNAMQEYIKFSASIDPGLATFCRRHMLKADD